MGRVSPEFIEKPIAQGESPRFGQPVFAGLRANEVSGYQEY